MKRRTGVLFLVVVVIAAIVLAMSPAGAIPLSELMYGKNKELANRYLALSFLLELTLAGEYVRQNGFWRKLEN